MGTNTIDSDDCEAGNEGLYELTHSLRYLEWIHLNKNHCKSLQTGKIGKNLLYLLNIRFGYAENAVTNKAQ